MIERFIDYMQFSGQINEKICIDKRYSTISPVPYYSRGYRDEYGFRIYYGNPKAPTKAFVIASGEPLENMRSLGKFDYEILNWAFSVDAKFSRIDLAVTNWQTMDGMIFVEDVQAWYKQGLIDSNHCDYGAKCIEEVSQSGKNTQETLYIGDYAKRGKKGIFRAYDKGIDLDIGAYLATRLELEDRGEKAHNAALRLADTGDISGNFRARFNVRHKEFDRLMDADAVSIHRGKGKLKLEEYEENDKRWTWLLNQVAPALREAIERDVQLGLGYGRLKQFVNKSSITKRSLR